jgi:acyl-CoA synthetase (AMP-forming)/AMP-acid ligase II
MRRVTEINTMRGLNSLWDCIASEEIETAVQFHARGGSVALSSLSSGSIAGGHLEALRGKSVVIATHEQLPTALALIELDGVAARMVLCTPDLSAEQLGAVLATAQADVVLDDGAGPAAAAAGAASLPRFSLSAQPLPSPLTRRRTHDTQWILLTSGTTGSPKLVVHTFASLAGALPRAGAMARETAPRPTRPMVWSTFYDIRRYGGLQIYLRAVLSGAPLVLSSQGEPAHDFLGRAGHAGVTHISGTPSHWRSALMSGATALISPQYVRLSGEVADQSILDNLRAAYPGARVAHAFASTEAGVAFDVDDGRAGFPASLVGGAGAVEMKIEAGTLWIRSGRTAARYLGEAAAPIDGGDGFVDTGDMVELVADRYYFRGRRGGIINVGGLKVYPEEVESVLGADPRVRMARVFGRRSPITGAVVVAEVVLNSGIGDAPETADAVKRELLDACRATLAAHKVPAQLRFVPALALTAAGKLVRAGA